MRSRGRQRHLSPPSKPSRPRSAGLAACTAALGIAVAVMAGPSPAIDLAGARTIASTEHHAAVIVDTGETVKKVCVRFSEDSISGAEALRRANVDAVFASFSGKGQAVCAVCGVGCPAANCFCDRSRFWAYHRAAPGAGGYTSSRVGSSSTSVRDGDVEGWRWGTGGPPPYATVGEVCNVPEPAARSGASTSTSTPPATKGPAPDGRGGDGAGRGDPGGVDGGEAGPEPDERAGAGGATSEGRGATTRTAPAGVPGSAGTTGAVAPPPSATPANPGGAAAEATAGEVQGSLEPELGADRGLLRPDSAPDRGKGLPRSAQSRPSGPALAAFLLVLCGVLGWRWRLRRAAGNAPADRC